MRHFKASSNPDTQGDIADWTDRAASLDSLIRRRSAGRAAVWILRYDIGLNALNERLTLSLPINPIDNFIAGEIAIHCRTQHHPNLLEVIAI